MKIISKRQAMHIYRQHPESSYLPSVQVTTSGMAVSAITTDVKFRISAAFSLFLLNVVRTGQARTPFCAA